jgi:hypothetical protein
MATATLPDVQVNVTVTDLQSLVDKTMMVKVSFGRFGNEKRAHIKAQQANGSAEVVTSDETTVVTKAKAQRFRHVKKLLESPELEAIRKADENIRIWLDSKCVPYSEGTRLIPNGNLDEVYEKLTHYQQVERPALVDAFLTVYPEQAKQAESDLADQHNPYDFPSVEAVKAKFYFDFKILNFGVPSKLKKVSPAIWKAEQEKAAASFAEVTDLIKTSLRVTLHEMVSNLADKLTPSADGKQKRLWDSTVQQLQEFLNGFDVRNVTDDVELKAQVDKLKLIMVGITADQIKESENLKDTLAKEFAAATQVLGTMTEVKGRKFRD